MKTFFRILGISLTIPKNIFLRLTAYPDVLAFISLMFLIIFAMVACLISTE
jgi:hypothetical protein